MSEGDLRVTRIHSIKRKGQLKPSMKLSEWSVSRPGYCTTAV